MGFFNRIKQTLFLRFGIDKAIAYTIMAKIIQAGGSLLSLYLIALSLTKDEQGFYYTFGSILAIQIFFELGFNGIITQYAAHETASISTYGLAKNTLEQIAQSRLSSLLHFCTKWFAILSVGLFIILLIVGYLFFEKFGQDVDANWRYPWILLIINTCLSFVISPFFSFLEGLGLVKEIAKLRLIQQIIFLIILWSMLALGGKLYSAPIAGIGSLIAGFFGLLFSNFRTTLVQIWKLLDKWQINYKEEIFPYQWKIAISWLSGYFIFQLFNPVLFATEGAIVAGQMGMTMAALNGVSGLAMSWITTKVQVFSKLFAKQNFLVADNLFSKTFKQVLSINLAGVFLIILLTFLLCYWHHPLGERFLPVYLIALLGLSVFLNQMVFSWATFLRCHKKEPYLLLSVIAAFLTLCSTLVFGNLFRINGLIIGYLTIVVITTIWGYKIFIHNRKAWHG